MAPAVSASRQRALDSLSDCWNCWAVPCRERIDLGLVFRHQEFSPPSGSQTASAGRHARLRSDGDQPLVAGRRSAVFGIPTSVVGNHRARSAHRGRLTSFRGGRTRPRYSSSPRPRLAYSQRLERFLGFIRAPRRQKPRCVSRLRPGGQQAAGTRSIGFRG